MTHALQLTNYLMKDCNLGGKIKTYIAHVRDYEGRTLEAEARAHKSFLKKEWDYTKCGYTLRYFDETDLDT